MVLEQVAKAHAPSFLDQWRQIELDLVGVRVLGQADSLRQAHDVGVDADRLPAEGVAENHVGGFAPNPGERHKIVQPIRHFALVACDNFAAAVVNRLGLVAVEIDFANLFLEYRNRSAGVVFRRSIFFEQLDRHLIDEVIASLRRQDQRDQQFKRIGEIEIEFGVGMDCLKPVDDLSNIGYRTGDFCFVRGRHFGFTKKYATRQ